MTTQQTLPTVTTQPSNSAPSLSPVYRLIAYVPDKEEFCSVQTAWKNTIHKVLYTHDVNEIINRLADCMEAKLKDEGLNLHYHLLRDGVEMTKTDEELDEILTFAKWRLGGIN